MIEQELSEQSFDAPIAGESMTAELGSRPWQQPSKYNTVEEALGFYIPRLENKEIVSGLLDTLEMGIPVVTIANTMQNGAVMEGMHTVDVGILILPALVEMISYIAEEAGIKYASGLEQGTDNRRTDASIQLAVKRLEEKQSNTDESDTVEMPEVSEVEEKPMDMGLMSRRTL
mgnify:FL=1